MSIRFYHFFSLDLFVSDSKRSCNLIRHLTTSLEQDFTILCFNINIRIIPKTVSSLAVKIQLIKVDVNIDDHSNSFIVHDMLELTKCMFLYHNCSCWCNLI